MCMTYKRNCSCGRQGAAFHFKDNIITEKTIRGLYCPSCSKGVPFDEASMVADNGWVIHYDMEAARFSANGRIPGELTPDALFDGEYCTWNGIYPGDHIDSVREREAITELAKTNAREYFQKLRTWSSDRMEKLMQEGWRKARNAA